MATGHLQTTPITSPGAAPEAVVAVDGELPAGAVVRVPFVLTEDDVVVDAVVVAPPPGLAVALESPRGDRVDASNAARFPTVERLAEGDRAGYRLTLPLDDDASVLAHEGMWNLVLRARPGLPDGVGVPYRAVVSVRSHLRMECTVTPAAGATLRLRVLLTEDERPRPEAAVRVVVTAPDGSTSAVVAAPLGPGSYRASVETSDPGTYRLAVTAVGSTALSNPFTREQVLTVDVE